MTEAVRIWEKPATKEVYLLAGWEQWADAGSVSSGLPQHLVEQTGARRIGELNVGGCYLFQIPGTHHFLRPEIKLSEGYRQSVGRHTNELFYTESAGKGLVIFRGEEPHVDADRYAEAFFRAVKQLGVRRVMALGGVFAPVPFNKDREVHCVYSLPSMKEELVQYAVKFSDYEGGVTISTYLVDHAEREGIEFLSFYSFVPAYDLSQLSEKLDGVRIEDDFRAWHELMRRINHMFGLTLNLSALAEQSNELTATFEAQFAELEKRMPALKVREYLAKLAAGFTEMPFLQLDSMWENELGDILGQMDGGG